MHASVGAVRESGAGACARNVAALFPLIKGVEVKGVTAPFKNTGKFVNLDSFDVNWGKFVGPIPSKVRVTAKITTPVDASDPSMRQLVAARHRSALGGWRYRRGMD